MQDSETGSVRRKSGLTPAKRALLDRWLSGQDAVHMPAIAPRPPDAEIPLSLTQQRILFLELLEPGTAAHNLSICLEFNGTLDVAALRQSAAKILERHEVLRTSFRFEGGIPRVDLLPECQISIPVVDLGETAPSRRAEEARRLAEREAAQPFDLTQAPLIRLRLFPCERDHSLLLLVVHHTIADGWSLGVFLKELVFHYRSIVERGEHTLPPLPIQYADVAYWQRQRLQDDTYASSLDYWRTQLSGELPPLELPTDHPRPARQTFSGGTHRFELPADRARLLKEFSRGEDVSVFMSLLTVYAILLHRYTGQDEVIIGTPVANRALPEYEGLLGVFINMLPLRVSLSGDLSVREILGRVKTVCIEALEHQDLPFEKLVEALNPKRDLGRTPLFQTVLNMQNSPMPLLDLPGLSIRPLEIDRGVSQYDLSLMVSESGERFTCTVEYNRDLFEADAIERMFDTFGLLLEHALLAPDTPIATIRMMTDADWTWLAVGMNRSGCEVPRGKCIHQLVEQQAAGTPDAVAVRCGGESLSYRELDDRAGSLAGTLAGMGLGRDMPVGVYMERSVDMVVALLAVLKAGSAYLPLTTDLPGARLRFMVDDAAVTVVVTNKEWPLPAHDGLRILDVRDPATWSAGGAGLENPAVSPRDLAYIIYTSGSTGRPKGVMVTHASVVNFLWSMRERPGMTGNDALLAVTSISFDIAALELFLPLIAGGTVVVAGQELISNPALLLQAMEAGGLTLMQATPTMWQLLVHAGWKGSPDLTVLCGGEKLPRQLAGQLLERARCVWNMYGPTETTVWSAAQEIQSGDRTISIGRPIGNTQLYVLDRAFQLMPVGVVGELSIGGDGLARGYLHDPELTRKKFLSDPFRPDEGARLYRSGDLARYLPDGSIEILGRLDDQVKLLGHRIEPGEIVEALMQHPGVRQAVVTAPLEPGTGGGLTAYVVPGGDPAPAADDLRQFLRTILPSYMVPAAYIFLDRLPLTPGGKIDRRALPLPDSGPPDAEFVPPRSRTERIMAGIWRDVLGVGDVGIHGNFFDLGGASIQSLQIVALAYQEGIRIDPQMVFEHQTIAELSAQIDARAPAPG